MRRSTGERIQYLRDKKGWSQIDLAEKLGMSNSVLSRIESNKRPAKGDELKELANLLSTSTDYLSCKVDDPTPSMTYQNKTPRNVSEAYIKEVLTKYNIDLEDPAARERFDKLVDLFYGEQHKSK